MRKATINSPRYSWIVRDKHGTAYPTEPTANLVTMRVRALRIAKQLIEDGLYAEADTNALVIAISVLMKDTAAIRREQTYYAKKERPHYLTDPELYLSIIENQFIPHCKPSDAKKLVANARKARLPVAKSITPTQTPVSVVKRKNMQYIDGKVCKRQHIAPKRIGNRYCVVCHNENAALYRFRKRSSK